MSAAHSSTRAAPARAAIKADSTLSTHTSRRGRVDVGCTVSTGLGGECGAGWAMRRVERTRLGVALLAVLCSAPAGRRVCLRDCKATQEREQCGMSASLACSTVASLLLHWPRAAASLSTRVAIAASPNSARLVSGCSGELRLEQSVRV